MSNYNSIEKIISAEILRTNEDNLIANKICNTNFAGEIKNAGDSVVFIGMNEPTVSNYTGTLSYDSTQDSAVTLDINQDKVFAFKIKNLEELRSSIGLRDSQTKRASYNLKKEVDTYVLGLWGDAANQMDPVDATPANALSIIAQLKEKLEEANVPDGQSWIVIPPFLKAQLVIAGVKFQINNGINGTGMMDTRTSLGVTCLFQISLPQAAAKPCALQALIPLSLTRSRFSKLRSLTDLKIRSTPPSEAGSYSVQRLSSRTSLLPALSATAVTAFNTEST